MSLFFPTIYSYYFTQQILLGVTMNNKIRHNFFKTSVIGVSALVLSISSVHGAENIKFTSPNINILKPSNLKWSNLNQTATSPQVANLWGGF